MRVVADAGALYALYDRDDAHHAKILHEVKQSHCTLIVPAPILSELDYLLREFLGVDAELDFLNALLSGHYMLEHITDTDLQRCTELIEKYRDLDIGFADSSVVALSERMNIRHVLTVDRRHFRAIKPRRGSFTLLPEQL